ncbi:Calmodulin-binding protein 60 B like [Heracleum sosnowskyi]|uniref:Calmodulin-binding protein 60 B like n=1 Tax=Heracleum sosnowskyi TaxID=360622 RepID=A0AAD8HCT5_9APIA|nr:Calmodulin-binding protein 60 B like [Heracleum sosnowskyi]
MSVEMKMSVEKGQREYKFSVAVRLFGERSDDESEIPKWDAKRRFASATVLRDVMSGISIHDFVPRLEPFLRRVVQEEVNCAIQRFLPSSSRSPISQTESSSTCAWQLYFYSKIPSTLFTSSRVESEDCEPIKIVLVDTSSKQIITSGPMSSMKIEIVVLNGDFTADSGEEWTKKEFDACVIRAREGKRPLVTGDLTLTLRNGVADLGNICFTDNSSWIRSRKFRLGARVQGNSTQARVKEAKSEPFIVKDHRGESYKKHHPPTLADEVWRLERIAKDGAFHKRLASARIFTVEDFCRLYITDPTSLRNVLGGGISNRTWETITEHATRCTLDDKIYLYRGAAGRVLLVFNSIWKAIGAIFDDQNFQNLDKITPFQMSLVEDVKLQAYRNLTEMELFNEGSFIGPPMLLSSLQAEMSNSYTVGQQNVGTLVADEDQLPMLQDFGCMTTSSPYTSGVHNEGYSVAPSRSPESVLPSGSLANNDTYLAKMATWQGNENFLWATNQSIDFDSSNIGFCVSTKGRPGSRWFKLRTALKWGISIRRDAAAKKLERDPVDIHSIHPNKPFFEYSTDLSIRGRVLGPEREIFLMISLSNYHNLQTNVSLKCGGLALNDEGPKAFSQRWKTEGLPSMLKDRGLALNGGRLRACPPC